MEAGQSFQRRFQFVRGKRCALLLAFFFLIAYIPKVQLPQMRQRKQFLRQLRESKVSEV
jgi:hypothetical protein